MRLYHFTSAEHALSAVALQRLKIARIAELNDPFELIAAELSNKTQRRAMEGLRTTLSRDTGLLCFSENWDHLLMWSHYASKHGGICLGFDVSDKFIERVRYSKHRIPIVWGNEALGQVAESFMRSLLFTKSYDWSYEFEFRAYLQLDEATVEHGLYYYPFDNNLVLREIIRGPLCEMPAARLATLIRAIDASVIITEAELAAKSFKIIRK
jgi:hypothetical protein